MSIIFIRQKESFLFNNNTNQRKWKYYFIC